MPTATVLPDAVGSTTVDSTGRTGSGASVSCLQPAVSSAKTKMLAMIKIARPHEAPPS